MPTPFLVVINYPVGSIVFHVNATTGIREAIVQTITMNSTAAGTTTSYNIAFKNAVFGSTSDIEANLYPDIDSAFAAYSPLVLQY
jgi:hypothetical protein